MIRTFDEPDSPEIKDFWLRVSHFHGPRASGTRTLSGWITAFAFWDEDGQRIERFAHDSFRDSAARKPLTLDGVQFPLLYYSRVPRAVVSVPVTVTDGDIGKARKCTAIAGSIGMGLTNDGSQVQPLSGWCLVEEWQEPLLGKPAKTGSTTEGSVDTRTTSTSGGDDF